MHEGQQNNDGARGEQQPTPPRIYVASLSDYNAGILHAVWIEASPDVDTMSAAVDDMLQASPTTARYGDAAEETGIFDYEGFGELRIDENEPLSKIAQLAAGMERFGDAFAAYGALVGTRDVDGLDQFEERFQGEWESVEAYADDMLDQLDAQRVINEAPAWLQPYLTLDVHSFARDLELGGDIMTADAPNGKVWVFSAY
ncbi:MAG: antirestriction protein ArdA [Ilumatobacteraceae bacterium]|nr:antirestriction protein ArdA [Ilumatobacteraceae bacterium]